VAKFAAATAASACKAILERYIRTDKAAKQTSSVANAVQQDSGLSRVSGGVIFHGPVSGKYVVPRAHTTGRTINFNFN
jgi:hypothetical protein